MSFIIDTLSPSDRAEQIAQANQRVAREARQKLTREDEYRNAYVDARDAVSALYVLLDALNAAHDLGQWGRANTLAHQTQQQLLLAGSNINWLVMTQDLAREGRKS